MKAGAGGQYPAIPLGPGRCLLQRAWIVQQQGRPMYRGVPLPAEPVTDRGTRQVGTLLRCIAA
jgi:hypothetical protein